MTPLITANQLEEVLNSGENVLLCDCRFDLANPEAGRKAYEESHIPGAIYVDLDQDMSGSKTGSNGRHPLPSPEAWAKTKARLGISPNTLVVAYDKQGSVYASRLWWMLKWLGHDAVAVLNGGLQAWEASGGQVESGEPQDLSVTKTAAETFELKPALREWVSTSELAPQVGRPSLTLIDARGAARYRGEVEPIDPVAGHIPGALNRPFTDNLNADGFFKSTEQLRAEFESILAGRDPQTVVHHCGSGVSAVPNILAMELAGLGVTRLYPGSWSEWCNTPGMACAKG